MIGNISIDIPENHGLSSKSLMDFFTKIEQLNLNINSFMLLQNGTVTSQFWCKPYRSDSQQLLFSLSKSFTSIAVGIACDHGYFDLQDKVITFFPDMLPDKISSNLEKMTIHHLLSMNTGHHENIYNTIVKEKDWVKTFLSLDVKYEPGSFYIYNTHATHMLSAIVEKATGQSLVDFLLPKLFEPLGLDRVSWETSPTGITAGGMGLSLTTEGIAKFGQMLLNKGEYGGKRIVSEEYIRLATSEKSDNRIDEERTDFAQGYGYQFFLCRDGCYMGNGAFGQLCFVAPHKNVVIAATCSMKNMKQQFPILLDLIYENIINQIKEEHNHKLLNQAEDYNKLQQQLNSMTYKLPLSKPNPENIVRLGGSHYIFDRNNQNLQDISFSLSGDQLIFEEMYQNNVTSKLLFDLTKPVTTYHTFIKDLSEHHQKVVTYISWKDINTLELTIYYIETPYVVTKTFTFMNHRVSLQFNINVSFNLENYNVKGMLSNGTNRQI
ncbi:serine hydrolase domain-containing protein [Chengkuizengella axinellae]|uniref:Serine hydrolase n=1 Tax=Chengkuizengella axinellae TaxID=3064388 RepID=A0ABT9J1D1_9BACL|nr:serine hydrolase [Chengkuizengella sp. 2205SS18-9]MDP5275424.1 serine hydrolase [Chengkuizengella sp. 2205SS18-9]